ncbi:hypothetical protein QS62_11775 [Gallibacterium salpingitidis]|uniref:Type I restriction modification DNA specificity domain-containing protein n=2 Tax=Gallibacterium salpingitidis TaxID=505341 RepID=A0A1A7NLR9_9PAST|nr:hypothetical protein QS62_11775 [Gallibacterium salpingitidis]
MFVPKASDNYKVYEQKNAIQKNENIGEYYITKEKYESLKGFAIKPFDIIVSCAGTIGETYVLSENAPVGIINQALMLIRLFDRNIEDFYLIYFDFILKIEAYKESKGTAIKNIPPLDILKNFNFPLPPLAEQQRIVKEVEKWFAVIEQLEKDKIDLAQAIKQAKSKILDLAIRGKLLAQDPNDEPAEKLLKRINPNWTPMDNSHYPKMPFELPKGWAVCEFDSLFSNIASTPFQIYQKDINTTGKYPVISQSSKHIEGYSNNKTKLFSQVSIPIIIFGDHTKVVKFVNFPFIVGADGVKIITSKINPKFSYFLIMNASNKIKHKGYARHYSDLKNFLFLIPSLNEQQRIVEKIEQLFSELDRIQTMLEV